MKFLCVACDEAMTLKAAHGPDEGAMTVVYQCPNCRAEMAMLTNPMETQVVRSLGVSIGGDKASSEPMEMVRSSLLHRREEAQEGDAIDTESGPDERRSGSKCPFTEVVASAEEAPTEEAPAEGISWTAEAEQRLARIPAFARAMARRSIEQHAHEQGYSEIDTAVMDEVRGAFGM